MDDKPFVIEVTKADLEHGLVFGFAVVCTENGQPYVDKQGDHIPEDSMLEAAAEFMLDSRIAGEQHQRGSTGQVAAKGSVVFAWPLTAEIAKALDITTARTGLLVGIKPDPDTLERFAAGSLAGFSIGGVRMVDESMGAA